jgi:DNA helicase HerA-like ATPase
LFRRAPTFDPLQGWRGRPQRHLNAFGKTGSGKSTNIRALLAREAEQGTQIIILDPQPHARRLGNLFDFNRHYRK